MHECRRPPLDSAPRAALSKRSAPDSLASLAAVTTLTTLTTLAALVVLPNQEARACTSIIVGKRASADGSTMVTYAADSHELYGALHSSSGATFEPGSMRPVYDWDSGAFIGSIPEARQTYSVTGNMNEHQLVIAESTFGGRPSLVDPEGGLDYGSLIYVTLERAKTAQEAIDTIARLVSEHGYRSSGESFSIADPHETWILEIIGKGPGRRGAVWVAQRVPENAIAAHANQARIRTFPLKDPKNARYAPDVIAFAREMGWYRGADKDFSFADTYAPLEWEALRFCEARVWRVFDRVAPSKKLSTDYVLGKPGARPLPLWVIPDRKVSVRDMQALMRDHFEGTPFDLSEGVGAGPFRLPYRYRPLTWKVDGVEYLNERAIATQQTGFSFISQSRSSLPDAIGGLLWFGVDDAASSVYVPVYADLREVPRSFAEGTASLRRFSWDSAFWVFNWVANQAYGRYEDMIKDITRIQQTLEGGFFARQPEVEAAALKLHAQAPELARDYLARYSAEQLDHTVTRWRKLGEDLLVKYVDGNVKGPLGEVMHPPYPDAWYRRMIAERGDFLRVKRLPNEAEKPDAQGRVTISAPNQLGPLAEIVPKDFPWKQEKLVLVPGTAQCGQPPVCCVFAHENPKTHALEFVEPPRPTKGTDSASTPVSASSFCGHPATLVRIEQKEHRLPEPARSIR
ncbi:MAG: C69 family dipeptidase [Deltaproteobacteria bacterium]|nr:C69 family dipeptidase [Deltaproteobacteria bacterium]